MVDYLEGLRASTRVGISAVPGVVVGIVVAFFTVPQAAALIGWDVAAVTFLLGVWLTILTAVALALARAGGTHGGTKAYLLSVGLVSVLFSWLSVHTIYTLKYARLYYGDEVGGIDFNEQDGPDYVDFAYVAFTIGMTFQVSDTNLTAKPIRRTALRHALISYLFGAVIIAIVINIVASLL
jgi:uncharacterized membrane protein